MLNIFDLFTHKSHNKRILELLEKKRSVSKDCLMNKVGSWSFTARISQIRKIFKKQGFTIICIMETRRKAHQKIRTYYAKALISDCVYDGKIRTTYQIDYLPRRLKRYLP